MNYYYYQNEINRLQSELNQIKLEIRFKKKRIKEIKQQLKDYHTRAGQVYIENNEEYDKEDSLSTQILNGIFNAFTKPEQKEKPISSTTSKHVINVYSAKELWNIFLTDIITYGLYNSKTSVIVGDILLVLDQLSNNINSTELLSKYLDLLRELRNMYSIDMKIPSSVNNVEVRNQVISRNFETISNKYTQNIDKIDQIKYLKEMLSNSV